MDREINLNTKPKEEAIREPRPFASGSRQAPDPYDQFLERNNYYRKHVPMGCLFRTFSEQVFDVQHYHGKIRKDCIRWMRIKSEEYEKKIAGDFDNYLMEMSKPRSYGSFVELHALAHAYRRNVLLFEPYKLGSWFIKDDRYEETAMVFFSPDKHFDSVFPTSFIQQAAYCQALVYEILYVKVFKLPDVMYAVERMLHEPDGKALSSAKSDKADHMIQDRVVVTQEGRPFVFDTAEQTECVLDNYLLCHFHNRENFDSIVDTYRYKKNEHNLKETRSVKTDGSKETLTRELINPMLCDGKMSCVRQLLKEGITPFPYKVAKALDPNIYRNIEFDSWSDMRRELKYRNWYFEQNCLQVGAKCMVRLNDSDDHMLYGYIQEMSPHKGPCVVYVEDVAECRTVPYERLYPLSLDLTRSCAVPYKFRRSSAMHYPKIACNNHSRKKILKAINSGALNMKTPDNDAFQYYTPCYEADKPFCYTMKNFTSMNNFQPGHFEMMVMPFSTGGKSKSTPEKNEPVDRNERCAGNDNQPDRETTNSSSGFYDMSASSSMSYANQPYCYTYAEPFPYDPTAPSAYCALPYSAQQVSFAPHGPYPGTFYGSPYPMITPVGDMVPAHRTSGDEIPNFQAVASIAPNGSDLPLNDLVTLRYFYNLGVEYFKNNQFRLEPPPVTHPACIAADTHSNMNDGNEVNELANELKRSMNLNTPSASDGQNKQRVSFKADNHQTTKRKYGTKNSKKPTPSRNRAPETSGSAVVSNSSLDVGQQGSTNSADHLSTDVSQGSYEYTPFPYSHVPMMPQVRVPYYAVDSSHYMIPPYGHGFMAPSSDVMLIHENAQHPAINPLEAQYPPMVFASPSLGTGYAIMGYPQPPTHLNHITNGSSNADNNCNDAPQ